MVSPGRNLELETNKRHPECLGCTGRTHRLQNLFSFQFFASALSCVSKIQTFPPGRRLHSTLQCGFLFRQPWVASSQLICTGMGDGQCLTVPLKQGPTQGQGYEPDCRKGPTVNRGLDPELRGTADTQLRSSLTPSLASVSPFTVKGSAHAFPQAAGLSRAAVSLTWLGQGWGQVKGALHAIFTE